MVPIEALRASVPHEYLLFVANFGEIGHVISVRKISDEGATTMKKLIMINSA